MFKIMGYDLILRIRKLKKIYDINIYYKIYGIEPVENRRFYNIGAGEFQHTAWTNVDHESEWYKDVQGSNMGIDWDLLTLTPIPVEDNSAEIVYSSHTIEHINNEAAQNMFNESYRILKQGGVLRITTPNIDLDFRAYKTNDRNYFYWIDQYSVKTPKKLERVQLNKPLNEASIQQIFLWHFASSVSLLHNDGAPERINDEKLDEIFQELDYEEALDYCTSKCSLEVQRKYPGNHINWWNKNKLFQMLSIAGFKNIYLSGYGQSKAPVLRNTMLFDTTHPKISLYVEAIK
ncbi:MAG: methyltransferase domain-containing protein [Candidatus Heimdallarchaeota archaeon]|nr:MAG: methyltransferase domain-containing protein [Candidatus Heimdallarchaeota archaeon]